MTTGPGLDRGASLFALLDLRACREPDRVALRTAGGRWTRRALSSAIRDASAALHARGVTRGDRVGYLGANRAETLVLLFACARIGAIHVPLNTRLAASELATIVAHAGLRALVADDDAEALGREAIARAGTAVDAWPLDVLHMPARPFDPGPVDADAPVLIAYTSGTTGAPKGAVHTQAGLVANAVASTVAHGLTDADRVLTALPLFHVGGLCIQTVPALLAGATVLLHPRFDASAWLDAVAAERPTLSLMVPATLRAAITHPRWSTTDLSSLRVLMAGSSIVPRAQIDAVHARGVPLGQVYGATETGPVTIALRGEDAMTKAGMAGWPCVDGSVRLVDRDGIDVADGSVGEIAVRAPNVMRGYWRLDAGTGFRDGWFMTGDLARRDADGCFEIVGRSRDLIISGGENVHPGEVEAVVGTLDGVVDVAVVGMADERWGEVPVAFVVPRDGVALDEARVLAGCEGRLARFKQPKRVIFVDALPKNAMGKVLTADLRRRLSAP